MRRKHQRGHTTNHPAGKNSNLHLGSDALRAGPAGALPGETKTEDATGQKKCRRCVSTSRRPDSPILQRPGSHVRAARWSYSALQQGPWFGPFCGILLAKICAALLVIWMSVLLICLNLCQSLRHDSVLRLQRQVYDL